MNQLVSTNNKLHSPQVGTPVHAGILYPNAWLPGTDKPIPFADLEHQFQALEDLADALPFVMGDLLNYTALIYGESYPQISRATGIETERLRQYKWVMGVFMPDRRYPMGTGIRYSHYRYCAKLPTVELQDMWLAAAYANQWTSAELAERIKSGDSSVSQPYLIPARLSKDATPKAAAEWLTSMYDAAWLVELMDWLPGLIDLVTGERE